MILFDLLEERMTSVQGALDRTTAHIERVEGMLGMKIPTAREIVAKARTQFDSLVDVPMPADLRTDALDEVEEKVETALEDCMRVFLETSTNQVREKAERYVTPEGKFCFTLLIEWVEKKIAEGETKGVGRVLRQMAEALRHDDSTLCTRELKKIELPVRQTRVKVMGTPTEF